MRNTGHNDITNPGFGYGRRACERSRDTTTIVAQALKIEKLQLGLIISVIPEFRSLPCVHLEVAMRKREKRAPIRPGAAPVTPIPAQPGRAFSTPGTIVAHRRAFNTCIVGPLALFNLPAKQFGKWGIS
jgi:hypothetical protein